MSNSIRAGVLIGMGGVAYVTEGGIAGAFLFSVGLMAVLILKADLYTGKVCFRNNYNSKLMVIFAGNLIGAIIMGFITSGFVDTYTICQNKLSEPFLWLPRSILCGMFIAVAVRSWERIRSEIIVILSVMGFILTGSEHVVANIYYLAADRSFSLKAVLFIIVCLIGNTIGGYIMAFIIEKNLKKE